MRVRVAALTLVAALTAGCDGAEPAPPASPSSVLPTTSSSPGRTDGTGPTGPVTGPVTGPTGPLPSSPPGANTLGRGRVSFQLSGDVEVEAALTRLVSGVAATPPGGFALVWTGTDADATTVGIGGGAFTGTQPTSPTLVLTITSPTDDGFATWVSSAGECEVRIDVARPDRFAGSFLCREMTATTGETVRASGAFAAAR